MEGALSFWDPTKPTNSLSTLGGGHSTTLATRLACVTCEFVLIQRNWNNLSFNPLVGNCKSVSINMEVIEEFIEKA